MSEQSNQDVAEHQGPSSGQIAGLIAAAVGSIGVVVFAIQNSAQTPVEFLMLSGTVPLYVVIIGSMILGAVIGWFSGVIRRRRRRRRGA